MARQLQLAVGLLLVAAAATAASAAKAPMLVDHLLGSPETARTASAQPASYEDDTNRVCFTETAACKVSAAPGGLHICLAAVAARFPSLITHTHVLLFRVFRWCLGQG